MHRVLIVGAGKIGSLIAVLLAESKDYQVILTDIHIDSPKLKRIAHKLPNISLAQLNADDVSSIVQFIKQHSISAVMSCLPYYCNLNIARAAKEADANYFDLTEDTHVAEVISELSANSSTAFAPQCGLAPGFISIVANHLMADFPRLDTVKMRVGALPINVSNALQYYLTWSTDGLINEYGNLCNALEDGKEVQLLPLSDKEEIQIDGLTYEAFNTSGGIGSLTKTYVGKVKHLSYKTIRYPGHCDKMRFLMNDLKLNYDRETLKRILEHAIPKSLQDVVLVYVSVTGLKEDQYIEKNYVKKFYPKKICGFHWSAIQLTTASALCAVADIVLTHREKYRGLIKQEQFSLEEIVANRFGDYYA